MEAKSPRTIVMVSKPELGNESGGLVGWVERSVTHQ